jgi:hypothetical protein
LRQACLMDDGNLFFKDSQSHPHTQTALSWTFPKLHQPLTRWKRSSLLYTKFLYKWPLLWKTNKRGHCSQS